MKDILLDAEDGGYGVGAFNLLNMEAVQGALEAAEELQSPLIMQLAEVQLPDTPIETMIPIMLNAADAASVPVAVNYDHGLTFDNTVKALQYGCTSVMFDAGTYPFEENIRMCKEISLIAHAMGADFEAELGVVGGAEGGEGNEASEDEALLTNAGQAAEFVERTECDMLAVAIGNAHGPYTKKPNLRFDRLEEINNEVAVPLVLHGGSGISDEDFRRAIALGIRKINVFTAMRQCVGAKLEAMCRTEKPGSLTYPVFMKALRDGVREEVAKHMRIFMSDGKA